MSTEIDNGDSEVQHSIVQAGEENDDVMDRSFTLRALISGLFIGVLVNLSNTYYGLQIGAGSQMSMVSGYWDISDLKCSRVTLPYDLRLLKMF